MHILKHKLLGLPLLVWGLQLLYVVLALTLFVVFLRVINKKTSQLPFQVVYVLLMIIIDIIWRLAIKKLRPEWF